MKYLLFALMLTAFSTMQAQQTDSSVASAPTYYTILLKLEKQFTDPANWTQQAISTVQRHFIYYQEMEKKGTVLFGGRTDYKEDNPAMFGIIVFKAASPAEAEKVMKNDPAIMGGIMQGTVHPFVIAFGRP